MCEELIQQSGNCRGPSWETLTFPNSSNGIYFHFAKNVKHEIIPVKYVQKSLFFLMTIRETKATIALSLYKTSNKTIALITSFNLLI